MRPVLASLLLLSTALAACVSEGAPFAPPRTDPLRRPVVERVSSHTLRIRWPESFTSGAVAIYVGLSPDAIDRSRPLAVVAGGTAEVRQGATLPGTHHGRRLYFELAPRNGRPPAIVAERRLPLEGANNFRDLGGYRTATGETVRWGRLYRTNDLSQLTREDLTYLGALDISLVCDFRSEREVLARPNRHAESGAPPELRLAVVQPGVDPELMKERIRTGGITALGVENLMKESYRSFVTEHADQWAAMFQRISRPESLPTVVHCTAGKDRTGFASALVLSALGVPEDTIFEDYLATNRYTARFRDFVLRWVPLYSLFRTDPDDLLPLLEARREYLEVAFQEIRERDGSVDAYLEEELGVTPEMRASLRALLLAPAPGTPTAQRVQGGGG